MSAAPPLATDAALVLGIASTAMPFAGTPDAEAECWLRILRLYGEAGVVLQALGVGEDRLEIPARGEEAPVGSASDRGEDRDAIAQVAEEASRIAGARDASGLSTTDLLLAVMRVYGPAFDRALRAHGTSRGEVTERVSRRLGVNLRGRHAPATARGRRRCG